MSSPVAVICSFRLGGTDGVSIEAAKWDWALRSLGFSTRRVAGELVDGFRPRDAWVPFLAIDPVPGARIEPDALAAAFTGADLVVVENICSLPLNETASRVTAEVLRQHRGRVLFHHHDLPWERPHLAHLDEFPPARPGSLHVTINDHARSALRARGIDSITIRNAFDLDPTPGDRVATRAFLGYDDADVVLVQPTRAIARKEVGRGIEYAERLAALVDAPLRFWITGPAEDGFGPELERLVAAATVSVTIGRAARAADAYAAADAVVFPSSVEGFGNPVVESVAAHRPLVVGRYPVLDELTALGFEFFSVDDPRALMAWLDARASGTGDGNDRLEGNLAIAREHFDLEDLPQRITAALSTVGWESW